MYRHPNRYEKPNDKVMNILCICFVYTFIHQHFPLYHHHHHSFLFCVFTFPFSCLPITFCFNHPQCHFECLFPFSLDTVNYEHKKNMLTLFTFFSCLFSNRNSPTQGAVIVIVGFLMISSIWVIQSRNTEKYNFKQNSSEKVSCFGFIKLLQTKYV